MSLLIQPAISLMWAGHVKPICYLHRHVKVKINGRCWGCTQQKRQAELVLLALVERERNEKWMWFSSRAKG